MGDRAAPRPAFITALCTLIGLVVAGSGARADEEVWALTEYRAGERVAVIEQDPIALSPEAAKSLEAQFDRLGSRAPGRHTVSLTFGRDGMGRRIITEIRVLR